MTAIDVAIVAYRRWDLTESCLRHLAAQTVSHRVQLCDNGCDEGTAERVRGAFPAVEVVRLERNQAYPIACNAAVAAGQAEIVVMMNNDVDCPPSFLEALTSPFADEERLGSATAVLVAPGEARIDSVGLTADRTLAGFPRFQGRAPGSAPVSGAEPTLTGPAGAAAAFRRIAWHELGGLDERVPAYMEDLDLALRLRAARWTTTVASDAVAVHIGGATFGRRSVDQRRRAGFSRGYLLRRYGVLRTRAALQTLATEAIVCAGDAAISHDLAALEGRVAGWRAARGLPRRAWPPAEAIDTRLGFMASLRLRRRSYD